VVERGARAAIYRMSDRSGRVSHGPIYCGNDADDNRDLSAGIDLRIADHGAPVTSVCRAVQSPVVLFTSRAYDNPLKKGALDLAVIYQRRRLQRLKR
jgi:hypothetical protein